MNKLAAFFESPSNRTGIAMIVGSIPAYIAVFASGHVNWGTLAGPIGLTCTGILKILQPENSVTTTQLAVATNTVPAEPASK